MNINKDNSNNRGGGKVDKKIKLASTEGFKGIWAGENNGITGGVNGEKVGLSKGQNYTGGKAVLIPKTIPNQFQVQNKKSTHYPQVIHKPRGERIPQ